MLQEMKQQLIDKINKAKKGGELGAHQMYNIARISVTQSVQQLKTEGKDLREISREAVTSTVQTLVDVEAASEENISAALQGVVDAIKHIESQLLNETHNEISQAKKHLKEEERKLAERLNEVFKGAKEASGNFTQEVKTNIETALSDTKLKSTELLGLTLNTVKDAVQKSIETGTDVEDTIVNVTRDATSKALAETHFSAERVRNVSEKVLSAAVEAAEELGSHVSEAASAATEGVRQGLINTVEFTRESISKAGKGISADITGDLGETKEDLEAVGDLFVETLRKVADKSGNVAKEILHELAFDAKKSGSSLNEKAHAASHSVVEHLKELGSEVLDKTEKAGGKAASAVNDEAKELSERMLAVASGAATGMWEGAKAAFHKDENKEDKS